jgi:hypothetical protein
MQATYIKNIIKINIKEGYTLHNKKILWKDTNWDNNFFYGGYTNMWIVGCVYGEGEGSSYEFLYDPNDGVIDICFL